MERRTAVRLECWSDWSDGVIGVMEFWSWDGETHGRASGVLGYFFTAKIFTKKKDCSIKAVFFIIGVGILIPVMIRLKWSFNRNTQILGLLFGHFGEFNPQLLKMQSGNFLIKIFG